MNLTQQLDRVATPDAAGASALYHARRLGLALLLACLDAADLQAQGGPPLETDDPGTPGAGHIELNLSIEAERERGGTLYDAPRIDANLGLGARFQLKLEVPGTLRPRRPSRRRLDLLT